MRNEAISQEELDEKIDEVIDRLKINNRNMIATIDARLDEFRSVIETIIRNFKFSERITTKKQNIFKHYIKSSKILTIVKEKNRYVENRLSYYENHLFKILKCTILGTTQRNLNPDLTDRINVYLDLVQRPSELIITLD